MARKTKGTEEQATPPYMLIAEQLASKQEQMFRATVYQLERIALNHRRYRKNILMLLKQKAEELSQDKDIADYLQAAILRIDNA